jgi:hypothetical protein
VVGPSRPALSEGGLARHDWTEAQLAVIRPFEGVAVRVVGYLVALKPQNRGSGESTNCHWTKSVQVDWHMALVKSIGDGEKESIVIETTPRVRQSHPKWTPPRLAPWVNSAPRSASPAGRCWTRSIATTSASTA